MGNTCCHGRVHAQAAVSSEVVVMGDMQGYGCCQIVQFLTKSQGQTCKPLDELANCRIVSLYVRSAYRARRIGRQATPFGSLCSDYLRGGIWHGRIAEVLDDCSKLHVRPERQVYRLGVRREAIGRNLAHWGISFALKRMCVTDMTLGYDQTAGQINHEAVRQIGRSFTDRIKCNQLGVGIEPHVQELITDPNGWSVSRRPEHELVSCRQTSKSHRIERDGDPSYASSRREIPGIGCRCAPVVA